MKKNNEYRILGKGLSAEIDGFKTKLNSNIAVIGGAGSGKTTGLIEPNLATCTSSFIVTDTKGQLAKRWEKNLRKRGYDVKIIDFVNFDKSGYDPLFYVRRKTNPDTGRMIYNDLDIMKIADFLVDKKKSKEPYWENAAAQELVSIISYVLDNIDEKNMPAVCDVLRLATSGGNLSIPFLEEYAYLEPESLCARTYRNMAKTFMSEKTMSSIDSIAAASVAMLESREIREMMRRTADFRFRDLGRRKTAVFLNVSDIDHTFDKLVNLAYTQATLDLTAFADSQPGGRLPVDVTLYFDDFGSSCVIPDFPRWISVLRSRGISCVVALQSYTQLCTNYSQTEASTIIASCDRVIYLGSNDNSTQMLISKLGNLLPEKVSTLPNSKAIYIERGKSKAVFVDKIMPNEYSPDKPAQTLSETMEPDNL